VLATTSPSTLERVDALAVKLAEAHVETQIEENSVRLCKNDVAVWLRVRSRDLALAWELARWIPEE
jgi:hypothetical protein